MVYNLPVLDYAPPRTVQLVYQYICDNPRCTRTDIAFHTGLATSTLNSYLSGLRYAGKIRRYQDPTHRKNGVRWEAGREEGAAKEGEDPKIGIPKQRTVSEWETITAGDPLIDLFFGRVA